MANTVNKNVIIPEVYAELVREKIKGRMATGQFLKTIDTLHGNPGETITMPAWSYVGDASDWSIGTAMTTKSMVQTNKKATVKAVAAPGIQIFDYDNEVSLGDALDEAAKQQAISIARKIDIDAINAAYGTPLKQALATKDAITQTELLSALSVFGDERDTADFSRGGIIMHSSFADDLYGMDLFTSRERTTVAAGSENGITKNGVIGQFLGIDIILSDRLYDSATSEPYIMFIKNDSIGWIPKESPFVETARDASKRLTNIYCSEFYAMALIRDDGVVLVKKTLPTQEED